jgi:hypothetical protein
MGTTTFDTWIKRGDGRWWDQAEVVPATAHRTKTRLVVIDGRYGHRYEFNNDGKCVTKFGNEFFRVEIDPKDIPNGYFVRPR